jgi:hypothetical protein
MVEREREREASVKITVILSWEEMRTGRPMPTTTLK